MKFTHLAKFLVFAGLFTLPALGYTDWNALNMTEGATEVSKKVFDLHMLIFWICVVIGIVVFGVMFYSM